ncbi:DUF805 domain-containing protein [Neolewinella antarctica]|uniref:Uncharacterized membrane protein YhaH (DUF805 family) n=1 Tax=Neolewinella antarctica TaxID=442734 RepID=A0ABX0XGM7_9BACT|nr:DUF805 domain-containing protein [Neolewinella antarctica]NJC28295.1 uncharacterized membrane protein YhaH (DUF805 family) [Neolewinella antarctica]
MFESFTTALGKFATIKGRARRKEFWSFIFISSLIGGLVSNFYGNMIGHEAGIERMIELLFFIPSVAVTVRRLHDLGRTGWWILLAPTGVGTIILFFMMLADGQPRENRYGADPKGRDDFQDFGPLPRPRRERVAQTEELFV